MRPPDPAFQDADAFPDDGTSLADAAAPGVAAAVARAGSATGPPVVTVVVPVYNPGVYLGPCIASLLAQTLPSSAWEVVFIDDGSTDASPARLDALAAAHPQVRVVHQANSGWPGQPRNRGIDLARGRYVLFLDHDDALGPEALERLTAFADRNGSDIVLGKLAGHGRGAPHRVFRRNQDRVTIHDSAIVTALTPHKLFRTAFLRERGIRFPEGRRRLEDQVFVLQAYFAAEVISILADYTCYVHLTRGDRANAASSLYDPSGRFDPGYYGRYLREVLDVVEAHTAPGAARDRLLARFAHKELMGMVAGWRFRVADRAQRELLVAEARDIAVRYLPPTVDARLGPDTRILLALLRAGRADELRLAARAFDRLRLGLRHARVERLEGRRLRVRVDAELLDGRRPVRYERADAGLRLPVEPRVAAAVPSETRTIPESVAGVAQLVLRRRRDSAEVVLDAPRSREIVADGAFVRVIDQLDVVIDPDTGLEGGGLARGRWDALVRVYLPVGRYEAPVRVPAGFGRSRPLVVRDGLLLRTRASWPRPRRVPDAVMRFGASPAGRLALSLGARVARR